MSDHFCSYLFFFLSLSETAHAVFRHSSLHGTAFRGAWHNGLRMRVGLIQIGDKLYQNSEDKCRTIILMMDPPRVHNRVEMTFLRNSPAQLHGTFNTKKF